MMLLFIAGHLVGKFAGIFSVSLRLVSMLNVYHISTNLQFKEF